MPGIAVVKLCIQKTISDTDGISTPMCSVPGGELLLRAQGQNLSLEES